MGVDHYDGIASRCSALKPINRITFWRLELLRQLRACAVITICLAISISAVWMLVQISQRRCITISLSPTVNLRMDNGRWTPESSSDFVTHTLHAMISLNDQMVGSDVVCISGQVNQLAIKSVQGESMEFNRIESLQMICQDVLAGFPERRTFSSLDYLVSHPSMSFDRWNTSAIASMGIRALVRCLLFSTVLVYGLYLSRASIALHRIWHRRRDLVCQACEYPADENSHRVCPECGQD